MKTRPRAIKRCHTKYCNRIFLNRNFRNEFSRKWKRNNNDILTHKRQQVTLRVEEKATVFEDSVVKLYCPERSRRPTALEDIEPVVNWSKGNQPITYGKRFHPFRNILKIRKVQLSDTAVYKCWSHNDLYHSMFLHVLPKPTNTSLDMNNQLLSDHFSNQEPQTNNYYKNELDLSQEAHKQKSKQYFVHTVKPNQIKTHSLNSYDSWEMSHNLSQSIMDDADSRSSLNYDGLKFMPKKQIVSWIDQSASKDLKFDWINTEWSNCTIPCGGYGFKVSLK